MIYPERLPEWINSMILFGFGLSLALPGETLSIAGYHVLLDIGFTDGSLGGLLLFVGAARLSALYVNGAWRRTPAIRMVGAVSGSMVFLGFGIGFSLPVFSGGIPNTAGITYLILAIWDVAAAYRGGVDAARAC